jgi:hypothetical protein
VEGEAIGEGEPIGLIEVIGLGSLVAWPFGEGAETEAFVGIGLASKKPAARERAPKAAIGVLFMRYDGP